LRRFENLPLRFIFFKGIDPLNAFFESLSVYQSRRKKDW
jgi:hypothetical protein